MDSLITTISRLQGTFIPYLLIFVGIGAIIFALIEQLGWELEITPGRQIWFAGVGGLMAIVGTVLIIFPEVVDVVEDMAPTPAPTELPDPFVRLTGPESVVQCTGRAANCPFEITGEAGGVLRPEDYLVYTFVFPVDPPGPGFFLQHPAARLNEDGSWAQFPALAANLSAAAESGNTIRIQAALIEKGAIYNDVPLNQLPPDFYLGSIGDIEGILALSAAAQLTVER